MTSDLRISPATKDDYGAFVRLEDGIEGLVHVSEMSWTRQVAQSGRDRRIRMVAPEW